MLLRPFLDRVDQYAELASSVLSQLALAAIPWSVLVAHSSGGIFDHCFIPDHLLPPMP